MCRITVRNFLLRILAPTYSYARADDWICHDINQSINQLSAQSVCHFLPQVPVLKVFLENQLLK